MTKAHDGTADTWDPKRYNQFANERNQPFFDLLSYCTISSGGTVVDAGCGTGKLTAILHDQLGASSTLGFDSSQSMIDEAPSGVTGLRFEVGDLATFASSGLDLIFANASVHWADDHKGVLTRFARSLKSGGELAVQVPNNFSHPSHIVANRIAHDARFSDRFVGGPPISRGSQMLTPEGYATLFYELGAKQQKVCLNIYGHELASSATVVDWVQGTLLTMYKKRLSKEDFEAFLERFKEELLATLGLKTPYFYAFPRILMWAKF